MTLRLCVVLLMAIAAWPDTPRQSKVEREQRETLQELERDLARRRAVSDSAPTNRFLHDQAAKLIERAKSSRSDEYRFERLADAADNLLEASERLLNRRRSRDDDDDNTVEDISRRLERSYFRVQQADYFSQRTGDSDAPALARQARALYQQGRSAWDRKDYRTARSHAEAAASIVGALEDMAHAAARVADPPRLE
jgi:hypothetical protein